MLDNGCVRRYRRLNLVGRINWRIHADWANWANLPDLADLPDLAPLPTLTDLSNLTVGLDCGAIARDVTRLTAFVAYFSH